jgi:uncharacterized C2H2 Zn-finger protein
MKLSLIVLVQLSKQQFTVPMAQTTCHNCPPQPSLADQLSQLISDPRAQNAITSITLRDGTSIQLNPERLKCPTCDALLANKKSLDAHRDACYMICEVHKLIGTKDPKKTANGIPSRQLAHATNPTYSHSCCFVSSCRSRYRVANGWSNLDIIQHVIVAHVSRDRWEMNEILMSFWRR